MVFEGIAGLEQLNQINFAGILPFFKNIFVIFALLVGFGIIIILFFVAKKNKKTFFQVCKFFEEVNGKIIEIDSKLAKELTIPNTNIKLFYIKDIDLYMPRPIRKMGHNTYWFFVTEKREILNFNLENINKKLATAGASYDHTDQRYAHKNLSDLIQRNYRNKAIKWWEQYKAIIGAVIIIFVISLCTFFLFGRISEVLDKIGVLIDKIGVLMERADEIIQCARGSGVVQA